MTMNNNSPHNPYTNCTTFFLKIHDFKDKHYIVTNVVTAGFGAFSTGYNFYKNIYELKSNLSTNQSQYTTLPNSLFVGFGLFVVLFLIMLLLNISDSVSKRVREVTQVELLESTLNFYVEILEAANKACKDKNRTFKNILDKILSGKQSVCPEIIDKPYEQLRCLIQGLQNVIHKNLFGDSPINVANSDVRVFLVYRNCSDANSEWMFISDNDNLEYTSTDLMCNTSLFKNLMQGRTDIVFENNKNDAFKADKYVPCPSDKRDDNGNLKGSILYHKIPINNSCGHKLIDAAICVYTCENKFVNNVNNEKKVKENFETIIKMFKKTNSYRIMFTHYRRDR